MNSPRVTIAMSVYNCSATIEEALESISSQTFCDWELIVCDDASTDNTLNKLRRFAAETTNQVTILENPRNMKLAYSLNRCIGVARGEFIARMDGDDRAAPERLAVQIEYLDKHHTVDMVGTSMRRFNERGFRDFVTLPPAPSRMSLKTGVPFAHATIMARTYVYQHLGGYDVQSRTERCEDQELWFRFFKAGFVGRNIDRPLYLVREDAGAVRRRTLRNRWNVFRITVVGYRLLGYPRRWYGWPLVHLAKGFVPSWVILTYRELQHAQYKAATRRNGGDRLDACKD